MPALGVTGVCDTVGVHVYNALGLFEVCFYYISASFWSGFEAPHPTLTGQVTLTFSKRSCGIFDLDFAGCIVGAGPYGSVLLERIARSVRLGTEWEREMGRSWSLWRCRCQPKQERFEVTNTNTWTWWLQSRTSCNFWEDPWSCTWTSQTPKKPWYSTLMGEVNSSRQSGFVSNLMCRCVEV